MINNKRFGIALSGGGYRAAGFHLGTLKKLYELGLLERLDVMSTISGGSITGAAYCLNKKSFDDFEKDMVSLLSTKNVIGYLFTSWEFIRLAIVGILVFALTLFLLFTSLAPLAIFPFPVLLVILFKYQFTIFPVSKIIERAYDLYFYKGAKLMDLCAEPEIAIGSTNLQTGRQFTFSKRKMEDSYYAYLNPPIKFKCEEFPVARAVIASSCVPFAFSPVVIGQDFFADPRQAQVVQPYLIDGGVYDNQGIHKITQHNSSYACHILLVSDAGNVWPMVGLYQNTVVLLLRTVELFMGRIKNFQMIQSIYQKNSSKQIAYQSLGWDLKACIPGFVNNLKQGNVGQNTVLSHGIPLGYLEDVELRQEDIATILAKNCKVNDLLKFELSEDRLNAIRNIGTNLIPIRKDLVEDMITHSAAITELQLRLYCPSLFDKS
ncbi:patatin-like phospholipase family protein [Pedobacter panaciterrae]